MNLLTVSLCQGEQLMSLTFYSRLSCTLSRLHTTRVTLLERKWNFMAHWVQWVCTINREGEILEVRISAQNTLLCLKVFYSTFYWALTNFQRKKTKTVASLVINQCLFVYLLKSTLCFLFALHGHQMPSQAPSSVATHNKYPCRAHHRLSTKCEIFSKCCNITKTVECDFACTSEG